MTVLGAAAAAVYVSTRQGRPGRTTGRRARAEGFSERVDLDGEVPTAQEHAQPSNRSPVPSPAAGTRPAAVHAGAAPTPSAEPAHGSAPTGGVTIVPLAMEASGAIEPRGPEPNGVPVPAAGNGAPARPRALGPVELPPEKRPSAATLAGLAAAAGLVALVLGLGAIAVAVRDGDGDNRASEAAAEARRAVALLSKPSTQRVPLEGSERRVLLAVGSGSRGFLVLRGLEAAPAGKAYEAWVVAEARPARPAALFTGDERLVALTRLVPPGATVGVTLENDAGSDEPPAQFRFVAERPSS